MDLWLERGGISSAASCGLASNQTCVQKNKYRKSSMYKQTSTSYKHEHHTHTTNRHIHAHKTQNCTMYNTKNSKMTASRKHVQASCRTRPLERATILMHAGARPRTLLPLEPQHRGWPDLGPSDAPPSPCATQFHARKGAPYQLLLYISARLAIPMSV